MNRKGLQVALVALALLIWGLVVVRFVRLTSEPPAPPASATSVAAPTQGPPAPFVYTEDFDDPFGMPVQASPSQEDPAAPLGYYDVFVPTPPPYSVSAIMGRVAVVTLPSGESALVRMGDWLGEYRVQAVGPFSIEVARERHTFTLSLTSP